VNSRIEIPPRTQVAHSLVPRNNGMTTLVEDAQALWLTPEVSIDPNAGCPIWPTLKPAPLGPEEFLNLLNLRITAPVGTKMFFCNLFQL